MHKRLRRQVDGCLPEERQSSPHLRKLLHKIEKDYVRADEDRASLQRALALLSDLQQRGQVVERRPKASRKARSLARLFEQAPFAALLCDADRKVTAWNAAAERLFGMAPAEAIGRDLLMLVFPDTDVDRAEARTELRQILDGGDAQQVLRATPTRSGTPRMCEWTIVPLHDRKGREVGNAALVQERDPVVDRSALAAQATGDGFWDWDLRAERIWLSESWRALVGENEGGDAVSEWLDRVHPEDAAAVQDALRAHLDGRSPRFENEHRLRHADGSWRWVLARGQAIRDPAGQALRIQGSTMDVTERKAAADRAAQTAVQEALAARPNRAPFLDVLQRSFARARRRERDRFAVLFVDLESTLGHAPVAELMERIGDRLEACIRPGDSLARHGPRELSLLLEDVDHVGRAESVAQSIHEAMVAPFEVSAHEVLVTAAVGIAMSGPAYALAEHVLHDAETAMYRAKAQGRGRSVVFDTALRVRAPQLLDMEAELRGAILREELRVEYLPIVDVVTGRIQGLEALIRWAHPERGVLAPEHFMPLAEESGLIVPVGRWLLGEAARVFQRYRAAADPGQLTLNVNLSKNQLHHGDLLEQIDGVLAEHGIDPEDLVVEVTEETLQHGNGIAGRLAELRARGVRLYMDDFGIGSSSLGSLCRFPLDSLKIDRSLFAGGSPRGQAPELVRTIVSLARDVGTTVVAEGVETAEQLGFVREIGCAAAQGFYFSPPVDRDGLLSLIERTVSWAA